MTASYGCPKNHLEIDKTFSSCHIGDQWIYVINHVQECVEIYLVEPSFARHQRSGNLRPKRVEVPAREVALLTVPTCLEKTTRSSVVRLIDEPQSRCRVLNLITSVSGAAPSAQIRVSGSITL